MTITLKVLAALAVMISMAASYANAGQLLLRGPGGYAYVSWKHRHFTVPRAIVKATLSQPVLGSNEQIFGVNGQILGWDQSD
jgi:hypothetical protein